MKTRIYNKSSIMKLANHLMKNEGYDRSMALSMAWIKAKKSDFYVIEFYTTEKTTTTGTYHISEDIKMQEAIVNYYNNSYYTGD